MGKNRKAEKAARTILTKCLHLPQSSKLVIFGDETTRDVTDIFGENAIQLGIHPLLVYYNKRMQEELADQVSEDHWEFLSTAAAVMVCLNGDESCFMFRDHVRRTAWQSGCKVAHMPGIDLQVMVLADVDYNQLTEYCEILALALVKSRLIHVTSYDSHGNQYELYVPLEPWIRLPIISDGIIQNGSWGNVPSGETYVAPQEGLAYGDIVINGSLPGHIVKSGEEIVLSFQKGRLIDWKPRQYSSGEHFEKYIVKYAQSKNDPNWNILAEIGLGVNPKVLKLTGNPLLDEKKFASLHIAIGDNIDMGGNNKSSIHCDMVCLEPDVYCDEIQIMGSGKLFVDQKDWREDFRSIMLPNKWSMDTIIQLSPIDVDTSNPTQLRRLWHTASGRICSVPVGDETSARLARQLYRRLERNGRPTTIGNITQHFSNLSGSDVMKITHLLKEYGLLLVHA